MSIVVYSFPRSGNFFITRAIAHTFESNIYHCLLSSRIQDLHTTPLKMETELYEKYCEEFGYPKMQPEVCHCTPEGDNFFVYKSHNAELVKNNRDKIDCVVVILRRPTNILRSHVQHQYVAVEKLEDDLISHAKDVYQRQLAFFERFLTIRASIEAGQDNWLQVITNSLLLDLPVFIVDYEDAVRNVSEVIENIAKEAYDRDISIPENYELNLSKRMFLEAQEKILDHFIKGWKQNWDGTLYQGLVYLTKWAYENDIRMISKENEIYHAIKELPPAIRADNIYTSIRKNVPSGGLWFHDRDSRENFLKIILDELSDYLLHSKRLENFMSNCKIECETNRRNNTLERITAEAEMLKKKNKIDDFIILFSNYSKNYSDLDKLYKTFKNLAEGQLELIETWISKSIREKESLYTSFFRLALDFYENKEIMDAIIVLSTLVKHDPRDYEAWNDLGVAFYTTGDNSTAETCFREALKLKSDYPEARKNLSILLESSSSPEKNISATIEESTPLYQYTLEIENLCKGTDYVLSFDVYPVDNGIHPERHYGYWNKVLAIQKGEKRSISIVWDPSNKKVLFNGEEADDFWKGDFKDLCEYRISFILYKDGLEVKKQEIIQNIGTIGQQYTNTPIRLVIAEESQLRSAIWFLTWKCNFRCPYCWEAQRQERGELIPEPFIDSRKWVEAWNRLRPQILDITGGEPWLQPRFLDLLEALDDNIKIAITTNVSKDITQFVQRLSPDKVFSMTLSLHPTQKMNTDLFVGKCLLLKNRGFNITVNYVAWPEQMWLIPMYKQIFENHGIRFHIDPYSPTALYAYEFSQKEKDFLRQFVGEDRSAHWFGEIDKSPVLCSGGYNHLNVQPNGDAYRCIEDRISEKPKVGNILDPDFKLNTEWTYCDVYHRCPSCDLDKISVKKLENQTGSKSLSKAMPVL